MESNKGKWLMAVAATALLLSPLTHAAEEGEWKIRVGVGSVDPKSSNGEVVSVDSGTALVFNGTYMFTNNVGLEVLAATPFSHDITLVDGTAVGETKHLPPTVSLQYHFNAEGAFQPYVGAGLNYTLFFDEETEGPLAGLDLDLDASFGPAVQLGFDYDISESMYLNLDVRWIGIDTDATLDGAPVENVEIDPIVYSFTVGWKF